MEPAREKWLLIVGNLALKQVLYWNKGTLWLVATSLYSNEPSQYHYQLICIILLRYIALTTSLVLQLQATVLGLFASLMATLLGWMAEGTVPFRHVMLLCSTSISTAFVASLLQGNNTTHQHLDPLSSDRCIAFLTTSQLHLFKPSLLKGPVCCYYLGIINRNWL